MTTPTTTTTPADALAQAVGKALAELDRTSERLRAVVARDTIPVVMRARALIVINETTSKLDLLTDDLNASSR